MGGVEAETFGGSNGLIASHGQISATTRRATADQHVFVSPAARARYERWEVDPRCQREHAEDVEVRAVARRVVAEIWP
jgi:hypothetical protein